MLGDTGVAVNPEDPRQGSDRQRNHGLCRSSTRRIPILGDEHVDMGKRHRLCENHPAHDFNTMVGKRHQPT